MGDGDDTTLEERLRREHAARFRALPLADLRKRIIDKAGLWKVTEAVAIELAQGALSRLLHCGGAGWDYENDPTGWKYVVRSADNARKGGKKKDARRKTELDTDAVEEAPPSSDPGMERQLLAREEATWLRAQLLKSLVDSPVAVRVVETCIANGEMTPAELALELNEPVERIYNASKRIAREMVRVRAAWNALVEEGAA